MYLAPRHVNHIIYSKYSNSNFTFTRKNINYQLPNILFYLFPFGFQNKSCFSDSKHGKMFYTSKSRIQSNKSYIFITTCLVEKQKKFHSRKLNRSNTFTAVNIRFTKFLDAVLHKLYCINWRDDIHELSFRIEEISPYTISVTGNALKKIFFCSI